MREVIFAAITTFLVAKAHALNDCSLQAESYLKNPGAVSQPGQFLAFDSAGNFQYTVRSHLNGGDSAHIIVVTPNCQYISQRLLWSE